MAERVLLTIGTKKGVFVAEAARPRRRFTLRGPFGDGVPVYATLVGAVGEGIVIDTDHWRHYFLMLGIVWGLVAASRNLTAARAVA